MAEIVLVVEYKLKPEYRDAYLARARQHRKTVLANEPGCKAFDILTAEDDPAAVLLHEVYADEAAFEAHGKTPYMAQYRTDIAPMTAGRAVRKCRMANDG